MLIVAAEIFMILLFVAEIYAMNLFHGLQQ